MKKSLVISLSTVVLSLNGYSQQKWTEIPKDSYSVVKNSNGLTLGYAPQSGVKIITVDGLAFKDLNKNGKLDKNFMGIPKEGYAASNNDRPAFSAPRFKEASFVVSADSPTTLKVQMGY